MYNNKTAVKIIFFVFMLVNSNNSISVDLADFYAGLDILQTRYATQKSYGDNVFAKNPELLNAFVGYRLPKQFFLEASTTISESKKRNITLGAFDALPGMTTNIPVGMWFNINSKFKLQLNSFGMGRTFIFDQCSSTTSSFLAGLANVKVRASYEVISSSVELNPSQAQIDFTRRTFNKQTLVPYCSMAINQQVGNDLFFRVSWTLHKLNNIQIKSAQDPNRVVYLKNKSAIGLGFVYYL